MDEEKVTEVPAQIVEPGFAEIEIVDVGLTTNGTPAAEAEELVLLTQVAEVVAVTLTDCSCATEVAVVLKLLPVAPGTALPFMLH